ncbi:penicillin-binding protein 1C [Chitinivorax tropicus]|uniref:peptidoglycan glycosyltransferase n=1 Tax=Chitinivorax tropicus TaxID=714531 RepID=A0A840MSH8_9PROT|nr:penicillin-binding protein 1C [Chitinivorax tropicus]MBB5020039.1 penicillin-binding protein 1C [Chitinivorax tropicus]
MLLKRFLRMLAGLLFALAILRLWPHEPLRSFAPESAAIWSHDGELLRLTLAADQQYRLWTPLEQISPRMIEAVKVQEDRWFDWHPGVNPVSILRGAFRTYAQEDRQGGSTLSMQLVRMIHQLNTRNPAGKLKQIGLALWLEARYSKHDILEAYLNLVPYGRNLQGVGAASLTYFGKTPDKLSLPEAITLAVIPQHPNLRADRLLGAPRLQKARLRVLSRWPARWPLGEAERQLARQPLPLRPLSSLPFLAPHFVDSLLLDQPGLTGPIQTTLEHRLQRLMERQIAGYLQEKASQGVHNAAALLIDTRDQGVRAMIGSANYFNAAIDGQVNGTQAKRSPGSALKPFIFGMGLDQGILHPMTMLRDTPSAFGPFSPENFDGRFMGPISAKDALIRSRNIPAVWVASQLKRPSLYDFLRSAGITQLKSEQHYGLALVLGGGEITMEELAGLYTMLANHGELKPLRYLTSQTRPQHSPSLLSPQAAYLTLDMLSANPRPDGAVLDSRHHWPIAWKTGTSWGFRDAWTVGVAGPYVLAVWLGNFNGEGNPAFVGIDLAAPLFHRITDALNLAEQASPFTGWAPPAGIKQVTVCTASGDLPNAWCPNKTSTWFIPGKSPIRVSTLHRPVAIDNRSGRPACPPFDPATTHLEVFEFWSSDMLKLFREAGIPRRTPPRPAQCDTPLANEEGDPPRITSPLTNVTYKLSQQQAEQRIALQATTAAGVKELYWFANQSFIGKAPVGQALPWRPEQGGWYGLLAVDDHGRSTSRDVKVEIAR